MERKHVVVSAKTKKRLDALKKKTRAHSIDEVVEGLLNENGKEKE